VERIVAVAGVEEPVRLPGVFDQRAAAVDHKQALRVDAEVGTARIHGSSRTHYGFCDNTEVNQAGYTWAATVARADWAVDTYLQVVSDAASGLRRAAELIRAQPGFQ